MQYLILESRYKSIIVPEMGNKNNGFEVSTQLIDQLFFLRKRCEEVENNYRIFLNPIIEEYKKYMGKLNDRI